MLKTKLINQRFPRNELVNKLDKFIDDESIPRDKRTITLNIIYNLLSMACI